MSTRTTKVQSTMVIKFKAGVDTSGQDIIKSLRFSKIKVAATDEAMLAAGTAIGTLLRYPITQVLREDQNLVVNE